MQLVAPGELELLREVREDGQGVGGVEALVLEDERRREPVPLEAREGQVAPAPPDRGLVVVAAGHARALDVRPVARDAAAAAAEVEQRAELLDSHALSPERVADAVGPEPAAPEEPRDVGRPRDANAQLCGGNRQPVGRGRRRAVAQRLHRLPAAVRRSEQPRALQQAERAGLHDCVGTISM